MANQNDHTCSMTGSESCIACGRPSPVESSKVDIIVTTHINLDTDSEEQRDIGLTITQLINKYRGKSIKFTTMVLSTRWLGKWSKSRHLIFWRGTGKRSEVREAAIKFIQEGNDADEQTRFGEIK